MFEQLVNLLKGDGQRSRCCEGSRIRRDSNESRDDGISETEKLVTIQLIQQPTCRPFVLNRVGAMGMDEDVHVRNLHV